MNLGRRNRVKVEGGMSSMTDLVFLLLIFFIIMSMAEPGVPVDLPKGDTENSGRTSTVNVGVTEDNWYIFDDPTKKPILESKMQKELDKNIKISGDRNADYEYVFNLIALSKQKGWNPVLVFKN